MAGQGEDSQLGFGTLETYSQSVNMVEPFSDFVYIVTKEMQAYATELGRTSGLRKVQEGSIACFRGQKQLVYNSDDGKKLRLQTNRHDM